MIDFGALPPEINSGRMYAGPGPGSMLAAAAAWNGLAAELQSAASSYRSVISALTSGAWLGPSSTAMAAAAAPYAAWMSATAGQAELAATQALAAAGAHAAAFAATVSPPEIAANRAQLMMLVTTNIFGQNTPAIATTEAHYGEMWAQDAAAMLGYAASSAATTAKVTPFTAAPQTTSTAGLAAQATAAAQTTGTSTSAGVQSTLSQLMSTVQTALKNLASPLSSLLGGSSSSGTGTGTGSTGVPGMGGLAASGFSVGGFEESLLLDYVSAPVWMAVGMVNSAFGGTLGPLLGQPYEYCLLNRQRGSQSSRRSRRSRRRARGGRGRAGCGRVRVRRGLRRARLGRFGGPRSSGLGRGAGGAAELGLGRYGSGVAVGGGAAADAGCAVGGQRSWRRIWFPIHAGRVGAGRSGGRCWGCRGRCCYEIPATP